MAWVGHLANSRRTEDRTVQKSLIQVDEFSISQIASEEMALKWRELGLGLLPSPGGANGGVGCELLELLGQALLKTWEAVPADPGDDHRTDTKFRT